MYRIKRFNELFDADILKGLKLNQFTTKLDDKKYHFEEKEVDNLYDNNIFSVYVDKMKYDNLNRLIILYTDVTYKGKEYKISIVLDKYDHVTYGTPSDILKGGEELIKFFNDCEKDYEYFDDLVSQIIDEEIPEDFWSVKVQAN